MKQGKAFSNTTFTHIHQMVILLTLTVLVTTIDAQWEGMGDVGSAKYEPALLLDQWKFSKLCLETVVRGIFE